MRHSVNLRVAGGLFLALVALVLGGLLLAWGARERASVAQAYELLSSGQPEKACALLEELAGNDESGTVTPHCAVTALLLIEAERQRDGAVAYDGVALQESLDMLPRLALPDDYKEALQAIELLSQ